MLRNAGKSRTNFLTSIDLLKTATFYNIAGVRNDDKGALTIHYHPRNWITDYANFH